MLRVAKLAGLKVRKYTEGVLQLTQFTSKWQNDELKSLRIPTRDKIKESEMKDCASWVIEPSKLPQVILNSIGEIDVPDRGPKYLGNMEDEFNTQLKKTPIPPMMMAYLNSALRDDVGSETDYYPLATHLLVVGGMHSLNNYYITKATTMN